MNIGDTVKTCKGGRGAGEGRFQGKVVGFSQWRDYDAANVRKSSGRTVQCLVKNLTVIRSAKPSSKKG